MKKTTIRSALAVLLAASTLTACGGSAASSAPASAAASSTAAAPAKQYNIGIAEAQANVKFIFSEVLKDDASTGNWCATTDVVDGMLTIVNPDLTAEEINTYLGTLDFETLKSMMG